MSLLITYDFEKEDFAAFNLYAQFYNDESKKYWRKFKTKNTTLTIASSIMIYWGFELYKDNLVTNTIFVGVYLLFALIQIFSVNAKFKVQIEKMIQNPNNASLFTKHNLSLSEKGIDLETEKISVQYKWNSIIKKGETNLYYFLFINDLQAIIIPKRKLKTKENYIALKELLTKHLTFESEFTK